MKKLLQYKVRFRTLVLVALIVGLLVAVWLNPQPLEYNDPWLYPTRQGILNYFG